MLVSYREIMNNHEFCGMNNAEVAPEICNEFVTLYIDNKKRWGGGIE